MLTWSLNSKKCLKVSGGLGAALLICASAAFAAVQPRKIPVTTPLATSLRSDLASRTGTSFDGLLQRWERQYGARAVDPLLGIAGDPQLADADRYVALMGAARLGGYASAPLFVAYLKDSSWMIRSASLRILTALENPQTAQAVLPLLKDPALVVRLEAVTAVQKLRPVGVVSGLVDCLGDEANYHGGKALWVPLKSLEALAALRASEAMPKLKPLLEHITDPDLLAKTVDTLDSLAGQPPESEIALQDRVTRWKVALGSTEKAALPAAEPAVLRVPTADSISSSQAAPTRNQKLKNTTK
jgi:HEAT repeat protein